MPALGTYGYAANKPHAVTQINGTVKFGYDLNGNMIERNLGADTYQLNYDGENRLSLVSGTDNATFVCDGDGNRVLGTVNGKNRIYWQLL